jgi:hypothetical protein
MVFSLKLFVAHVNFILDISTICLRKISMRALILNENLNFSRSPLIVELQTIFVRILCEPHRQNLWESINHVLLLDNFSLGSNK